MISRVFAQTTIRITHYQDEATVPDNIGGDATVPDNIGGEATDPDNIGGKATVPDIIQGGAIVSDNIGEATAFEKEVTNEVIEQWNRAVEQSSGTIDGSITHTESDLDHQNGPISRGTISKHKVLDQALQNFMSVFRRTNLQPRSD